MTWTRLLLASLMMAATACPATGGEGEGESAEGEGDQGEGEGEGEGDGGEGEGEAPSGDATVAVAELLEGIAPFFARCQAALLIAVDGQAAADGFADLVVASARPPYPAGSVPDLAAFDACRLLLAGADCNAINDGDSPCDRLFVGTRALGDPCRDNRACVDGLCAQTPGNDCGVCTAGEPCFESDECAAGDICDFNSGACQAPAALGEPCSFNEACAGDNICFFDPNDEAGSCSVPAANGEPCTFFGPGCRKDSFCNSSDVCVAIPGAGQACTVEGCLNDLSCINNICVAVQIGRVVGDPCTLGTDLDTCSTNTTGLFCSAAGTCTAVNVVEVGDACDNTARFCRGSQQAGLSACINGTCVAGVAVGDECVDPAVGNGPPCIQGSLCEGAVCVAFPALGEPCAGICSTGNTCVAGTCARLAPLNEPCGDSAVCGNGTCVGGTCRFLPDEDTCPL